MASQNAASFSLFADALDVRSVCLFLVVFAVIWRLFRGPKNLPPGPRRWPLLGNIPALARSKKHPHELMAEWAQQHGGVMAIQMSLGRGITVVLSDIHTVKEALLKQGDQFSDRAMLPLTEKLLTPTGSFLWANGDAAKEQRRFGLGALRKLGVGKKSLELKINEEIRYLVECFEAEKNRPFDPNLHVHNAVSNIICTISFGYRFDYADPKFKKLLSNLQTLFQGAGFTAIGNLFPPLISTPLYSENRKLTKLHKDFITGIVQEHRDSYDPNDFRDIIDMYIAEIKQRERDGTVGAGHGAAFTEQHVWRGIVDLFGAGTDTTSNTVLWLVACVLNHPEIHEKIQKEVSDVVGGDRQPSCEDRPNMPYTNAAIMEIQRWRPVAPIAVPYKTSQETQLNGYTIPKETSTLINLWAVMNDPNVWERPEEFNPGRFLSEDGKKVIQHDNFIPFSIGRRYCLGESLAKMELFLFVTNLLQRFTFKLPVGAPRPSMVGISGITFTPEPFKVCAVKR